MRALVVVSLFLASAAAAQGTSVRTATSPTGYGTTELERDLRARLPAFERCRAERAQLGEPVEGRVTIRVTVRENGTVWPATTLSDTTGNTLLTGCIQSSFLSMRVAAQSRQRAFTFVLTFTSRGASLGEVATERDAASAAPATSTLPPAERVISANVNVGSGARTDENVSGGETADGLARPRRAGEFDSRVVSAAIRRASAAIRRCYENELRNTPSLAGKLVIQFTIETSGAVTHTLARENTTGSQGLAACVVGAMARMRFNPGPTGGSVQYRYPFVFSLMNDDVAPAPTGTDASPRYEDEFTSAAPSDGVASLNALVQSASPRLRACFVQESSFEDAPIAARVVLQITVLESGALADVSVVESSVVSRSLAACLVRAVSVLQMTPVPPQRLVAVRVPYTFSP